MSQTHTHTHTHTHERATETLSMKNIGRNTWMSSNKLTKAEMAISIVFIHSHTDTWVSQTRDTTFSGALCISPNQLVGRVFLCKAHLWESWDVYECVFWALWLRYRSATREREGSCLPTFVTAFTCFLRLQEARDIWGCRLGEDHEICGML